MRKYLFILLAVILISIAAIFVYHQSQTFEGSVDGILKTHYLKYKDKEYFSGIAVSIYRPNEEIQSFYVGATSHDNSAKKISGDTLFQIGSITKSFTAAIILQLEKEGKLKISDTLKQWLPQYQHWSSLNIQSLLDMTSGLPNYSDAPYMNTAALHQPDKVFSTKEVIAFSYPAGELSAPLRPGYHYTNTGYILSEMIIADITQHTFQNEIENRLFKAADLHDTFYPVPALDKKAEDRVAHGYGFNPYDNPELLGKDIHNMSLSWAGAAGAVISNTSDIIKWVKALFVDDKILDQQQKQELMRMVSTATGEPISGVSSTDPEGFALGVTQAYRKEIGSYWFYEGETLGFRALYMYVPANGIIISAIFNSAVNTENDHAGELMQNIYNIANKNNAAPST